MIFIFKLGQINQEPNKWINPAFQRNIPIQRYDVYDVRPRKSDIHSRHNINIYGVPSRDQTNFNNIDNNPKSVTDMNIQNTSMKQDTPGSNLELANVFTTNKRDKKMVMY